MPLWMAYFIFHIVRAGLVRHSRGARYRRDCCDRDHRQFDHALHQSRDKKDSETRF